MIGKMVITSSYGTVYVFSAEQFPTVVRNIGIGAASTSARIGGILAPYTLLLVNQLILYFCHHNYSHYDRKGTATATTSMTPTLIMVMIIMTVMVIFAPPHLVGDTFTYLLI
jgi:hypothetical protein